MASNTPNITCEHNAQSQVLKPGIPVPCIKCGALLQPVAETGLIVGQNAVNAAYPGTELSKATTGTGFLTKPHSQKKSY